MCDCTKIGYKIAFLYEIHFNIVCHKGRERGDILVWLNEDGVWVNESGVWGNVGDVWAKIGGVWVNEGDL